MAQHTAENDNTSTTTSISISDNVDYFGIHDLDDIEDKDLPSFFYENLRRIFGHNNENSICNRLNGRTENALKPLRQILLIKVAELFPSYTVNRAKKTKLQH